MYITNIFNVLAVITPFKKCLEKCILVHINKDGLNLSTFIVLLIKFSLARTECAVVTAPFSKSISAHGAPRSRNLLSPGRLCNICER